MDVRLNNDPHKDQPVLFTGEKTEDAMAAMILIHGRGSTAEDILSLSNEFSCKGFIYSAPQAKGNTWYPYSFLFPVKDNEPGISSGINVIKNLVDHFQNKGISSDKIILLGFSQGACLVLEFAARNAKKYGGVIGFSGGLIGEKVDGKNYKGSFSSSVVFLGCSDIDPHIPKERVDETARIFSGLGADVTTRIYNGMGHTLNQDELNFVRSLSENLIKIQKKF
jgi:predicted esterase